MPWPAPRHGRVPQELGLAERMCPARRCCAAHRTAPPTALPSCSPVVEGHVGGRARDEAWVLQRGDPQHGQGDGDEEAGDGHQRPRDVLPHPRQHPHAEDDCAARGGQAGRQGRLSWVLRRPAPQRQAGGGCAGAQLLRPGRPRTDGRSDEDGGAQQRLPVWACASGVGVAALAAAQQQRRWRAGSSSAAGGGSPITSRPPQNRKCVPVLMPRSRGSCWPFGPAAAMLVAAGAAAPPPPPLRSARAGWLLLHWVRAQLRAPQALRWPAAGEAAGVGRGRSSRGFSFKPARGHWQAGDRRAALQSHAADAAAGGLRAAQAFARVGLRGAALRVQQSHPRMRARLCARQTMQGGSPTCCAAPRPRQHGPSPLRPPRSALM